VSTTKEAREIDGTDGSAIRVRVNPFGYVYDPAMPNMIEVGADAYTYPHSRTLISSAAARELARHLLELADEADLRNLGA
jgi:hypothetical protein